MCGSRKYPYSLHERPLEIPKGRGFVKAKFFKEKYEAIYCCERSEQHPILYRGQNLDFSELLMSLAFVLLNNTTCVTTCVLSRSSHSVFLWRTFAVWVISLSIW